MKIPNFASRYHCGAGRLSSDAQFAWYGPLADWAPALAADTSSNTMGRMKRRRFMGQRIQGNTGEPDALPQNHRYPTAATLQRAAVALRPTPAPLCPPVVARARVLVAGIAQPHHQQIGGGAPTPEHRLLV